MIGNTSPSTPKPQKKGNKCGVFGQILLVAISVAISFALPAIAPGVFAGFWGGIGAAVVGSVVSQGVGLATGIQDKFSWKQVALAGISAAVGGGLGQAMGKTAVAGSRFLTDVIRGAASSALTQGIGVALGLQKKFDFVGVAAAGIGAGMGGALSRKLVGPLNPAGEPLNAKSTWNRPGNFGHDATVTMADAIAQSAARSLIEGSSFGDNLVSALPSAIGNTIGNAIGRKIAEHAWHERAEKMAASDKVAESIRGKQATVETIYEALAAGATNKQIRTLLGDSGAQDYILGRQFELDVTAAAAAGQASDIEGYLETLTAGSAAPDDVILAAGPVRWDQSGVPNLDGDGKSFSEVVWDTLTGWMQPNPVGRETTADRTFAISMAELANAAYDPANRGAAGFARVDPKRFGIDPKDLFDRSSGLKASIYSNGRQVAVVFAGTDGKSWVGADGRTNFKQVVGLSTRQYDQAAAIAVKMHRAVGNGRLIFVGHSLGGGLAGLAAAITGRPAITFNAAGVHPRTLARYNVSRANAAQVLNYSHRGDVLSHYQGSPFAVEALGRTIRVGSARAGIVASGVIGGYYHLMPPMLRALKDR